MSAYLGFSADLQSVLDRMTGLAEEHHDDWKAAAALVPGLDPKVRQQLAVEHLVHCYRLKYGKRHKRRLPEATKKPLVRPPGPSRSLALLAELGVTSGDVKAWAVHQGLLTEIKRGQVSFDLVELYALAHEEQEKSA